MRVLPNRRLGCELTIRIHGKVSPEAVGVFLHVDNHPVVTGVYPAVLVVVWPTGGPSCRRDSLLHYRFVAFDNHVSDIKSEWLRNVKGIFHCVAAKFEQNLFTGNPALAVGLNSETLAVRHAARKLPNNVFGQTFFDG